VSDSATFEVEWILLLSGEDNVTLRCVPLLRIRSGLATCLPLAFECRPTIGIRTLVSGRAGVAAVVALPDECRPAGTVWRWSAVGPAGPLHGKATFCWMSLACGARRKLPR
jgi:hypothetical protein